MVGVHAEDLRRVELLRWLADEMERHGESVFRKALIEIVYAVTRAKAVFAPLLDEGKDKVSVDGGARPGAERSRRDKCTPHRGERNG